MKSVIVFAFAAVAVAQQGYGQQAPPAYGGPPAPYGTSSAANSTTAPAPAPYGTPPAANATTAPAPPSYPTNDVYTTEVVTDYTTFCPQPTTFSHKGKTYTVTSATTLTLPCKGGCAVTKPVYSAPTTTPPVSKPVYPIQPPSYSPPWANKTTTEIVTSLTTYCPQPTTFTHGTSTYTVTSATTIVLPCAGGCTVTKPVTQPPVYTTKIVTTAITSYYPQPTTVTYGGSTITVTKPSTITLPCEKGCTVTETKPPVTTTIVSSPVPPPVPTTQASSSKIPPPGPNTYAPPAPSSEVPPPPPSRSSSSSIVSVTRPATTASTTTPSIVQYTGAAAPMKTGAPIIAAIAMGAFFL